MTEAVASALTRLSDRAAELHNEMMNSQPQGYMYKQVELQDLVKAKNINELMRYVQELTDNVSIMNSGRQDIWLIRVASAEVVSGRKDPVIHGGLV